MGLRGESQVSNDFPKIVDKIPDDRGRNRGKPGVNSVTLQRGRQRVFKDLLAVLEVSPVRWEWISCWFGFVQQRQSSDTAFQL